MYVHLSTIIHKNSIYCSVGEIEIVVENIISRVDKEHSFISYSL